MSENAERVDSNCGHCGKTALSCYVRQGCCKQCDHAEYWQGLDEDVTRDSYINQAPRGPRRNGKTTVLVADISTRSGLSPATVRELLDKHWAYTETLGEPNRWLSRLGKDDR